MVRRALVVCLAVAVAACGAAVSGPLPRAEPAPLAPSSSAAAAGSWSAPGALPSSSASSAAAREPFLRGVTRLSVGGAHACALLEGGEVACWGSNAAGQVGVGADGRAAPRLVPAPQIVGRLPPIVGVAAGMAHTCAIDRSGRVFCWGSAAAGARFSAGGAPDDELLGTPVEMPLGGGQASLVALARKGHQACVVVESEVRCWDTARAVKADGSLGVAPRPRVVGLTGVSALSISHGKVCAVAQGGLWCWRDGERPTPAVWPQGDAMVPVTVSMGEMHACVASAPGEARCWWSLIDDFWKKPPGRVIRWPKKAPTRAIAAGEASVCAVDEAGRVDCFLSDEGGLTPEAAARSWAARGIEPHPIGGVSQAIDVGLGAGEDAFGYGHGCALRARPDERGAQVFCWGDNEVGQLGTGSLAASAVAAPVVGASRAAR